MSGPPAHDDSNEAHDTHVHTYHTASNARKHIIRCTQSPGKSTNEHLERSPPTSRARNFPEDYATTDCGWPLRPLPLHGSSPFLARLGSRPVALLRARPTPTATRPRSTRSPGSPQRHYPLASSHSCTCVFAVEHAHARHKKTKLCCHC